MRWDKFETKKSIKWFKFRSCKTWYWYKVLSGKILDIKVKFLLKVIKKRIFKLKKIFHQIYFYFNFDKNKRINFKLLTLKTTKHFITDQFSLKYFIFKLI